MPTHFCAHCPVPGGRCGTLRSCGGGVGRLGRGGARHGQRAARPFERLREAVRPGALGLAFAFAFAFAVAFADSSRAEVEVEVEVPSVPQCPPVPPVPGMEMTVGAVVAPVVVGVGAAVAAVGAIGWAAHTTSRGAAAGCCAGRVGVSAAALPATPPGRARARARGGVVIRGGDTPAPAATAAGAWQ
jgi:hypothetical protein